jgi:hypothetical protein
MVNHLVPNGSVLYNPTLVLQQRFRIDTGRHRTSGINLGHDQVHLVSLKDVVRAVFGNGGIGKDIDLRTLASHSSKCITRAAGIDGRARRVDIFAKALRGFRRARNVGHATIVGDESRLFDEFVDASV